MTDMSTVKTDEVPQSSVLTASKRELENPQARIPVPHDFPELLPAGVGATNMLRVVEEQLAKQGVTLKEVSRINIAYPHKHAEKHMGHRNEAEHTARSLQSQMTQIAPDVTWVLADALHETIKLGRSEDQSAKHALMKHQVYDVDTALQNGVNPFEGVLNGGKEYFILADWCCAQGTTLANLMGYISHNGGTVLAAAAGYGHLSQQESRAELEFKNKAYIAGRIPDIAAAFLESARKDGYRYTHEECIDIIESGLKAHGNSLFALTDGECTNLIDAINRSDENSKYSWSFKKAVEDLGIDLDAIPPKDDIKVTEIAKSGLASAFGRIRNPFSGWGGDKQASSATYEEGTIKIAFK